jgi:hypothetical protein
MPDDELESLLARLPPATLEVDVVTLAYQAGHRAARRTTRLYQSTAAVLACTLLVLMTLRATDRQLHAGRSDLSTDPLFDSPSRTPFAAAQIPLPPTEPNNIAAVTDAVLERGLDGLPHAPMPHFPETFEFRHGL